MHNKILQQKYTNQIGIEASIFLYIKQIFLCDINIYKKLKLCITFIKILSYYFFNNYYKEWLCYSLSL